MKNIFISIFCAALFLVSASGFARFDHPYDAPPAWALSGTNQAMVEMMTATKDQNGAGLCYGFSATSLLENFLCKERNVKDCNQLMLSTLHVSSFRDEGMILEDSGVTQYVLNNIKNKKASIVREDCAPFPKYKDFLVRLKDAGYKDKDGSPDISKFEQRFYEIKSNPNCANCLRELEGAFPHLSVRVIQDLMGKFQYKEFLARAVISDACLTRGAEFIPAFEVRSKFASEFKSDDEIFHQVEKLVLNQIPVQMSIQVDEDVPPSGHAVTIVGVKKACGTEYQGCMRLFKVKNSYGKNWESQHNEGWVSADNLIAHFKAFKSNVTWIERPGQIIKNFALKDETNANTRYEPSFRDEVEPEPEAEVKGKAFNYSPSQSELADPDLMWKCYDGVHAIEFTNRYKGKHCIPRR